METSVGKQDFLLCVSMSACSRLPCRSPRLRALPSRCRSRSTPPRSPTTSPSAGTISNSRFSVTTVHECSMPVLPRQRRFQRVFQLRVLPVQAWLEQVNRLPPCESSAVLIQAHIAASDVRGTPLETPAVGTNAMQVGNRSSRMRRDHNGTACEVCGFFRDWPRMCRACGVSEARARAAARYVLASRRHVRLRERGPLRRVIAEPVSRGGGPTATR